MVYMSSVTGVLRSVSDWLDHIERMENSLFGFALPQELNGGNCSVSDEPGVDDRDLDIVLHVPVVSPYSFPQCPCEAEG